MDLWKWLISESLWLKKQKIKAKTDTLKLEVLSGWVPNFYLSHYTVIKLIYGPLVSQLSSLHRESLLTLISIPFEPFTRYRLILLNRFLSHQSGLLISIVLSKDVSQLTIKLDHQQNSCLNIHLFQIYQQMHPSKAVHHSINNKIRLFCMTNNLKAFGKRVHFLKLKKNFSHHVIKISKTR